MSDRSAKEKLAETVKLVRGESGSQTGKIGNSALLVRLANKVGCKPRELALRMTSETVRRTKYPVLEEEQPDGSVVYKEPIQIHEGPMTR